MIYIQDHAIDRFKSRFEFKGTNAEAVEHLTLLALVSKKCIYSKNDKYCALFNEESDVVLIAFKDNKDMKILTVEYKKSHHESWWKNILNNFKEN